MNDASASPPCRVTLGRYMIHYHVWFNLKPDVSEAAGLAEVQRYLTQLCAVREATAFQLLRNNGSAPRTKLAAYHAFVQFADSAHLGLAMKNQATRGIHSGPHGNVVNVVSDFHVEVFTLISSAGRACEPA